MIKKLKTYDSDNLQIGGKNEQISRENSESFFWKEKILQNMEQILMVHSIRNFVLVV